MGIYNVFGEPVNFEEQRTSPEAKGETWSLPNSTMPVIDSIPDQSKPRMRTVLNDDEPLIPGYMRIPTNSKPPVKKA